jgi:signal transduction histidine kinase
MNFNLNMAGHELRTPLTSLKLQTQMLKKKLSKQHIHDADAALSRMEGQLSAVNRLVEELFDFSKIQAGKLKYVQETVNLNEILQEIVDVQQQAQATHAIVVHGTVDAPFIGDKDRIGQVFLNLISNAIRYSPAADTVEVDISTSVEAVTISVRDQGIGIPQEQHTKIFERFYRAVTEKQHGFPGLGMGLYIVAEIVKHHSGTITVESEMGVGSTFVVTLPFNRQ